MLYQPHVSLAGVERRLDVLVGGVCLRPSLAQAAASEPQAQQEEGYNSSLSSSSMPRVRVGCALVDPVRKPAYSPPL